MADTYRATFGDFADPTFNDWVSAAPTGYVSFLTTYFIIGDDTMYWMQSPYIYVFVEDEDTKVDPADPDTKALTLQAAWDWSTNINSHKFSAALDCYKYRGNNLVAVSKNMIRGRGRALQLLFTSTEDLDFNLLGWGAFVSKEDSP